MNAGEHLVANPLRRMATALAEGSVTSSALLEHSLSVIDQLDGDMHAFVRVDADGARVAAREADRARRAGHARGPLHGIPVALKDSIDTAGLTTAAGSRILSHRVPRRDAAVVRDLRGVGTVIVGKLSMTEFGTGSADQPAIGPTRHPADRELVPGGSSSGAAVAVASGMVPLAIGTDTGGSVRLPAALCGVVGVRPSAGWISRAGIVPLARSLDRVGLITATAADACLALGVVGGHRSTTAGLLAGPDARRVSGRVVGRLVGRPWDDVDDAVRRTVDHSARLLGRAGAHVIDVRLMHVSAANEARRVVQYWEAARFHAVWMETRADEYDPSVLALLQRGAVTSRADVDAARRTLARFRASTAAAMSEVDLLLAATAPRGAWSFEEARGAARIAGIACTTPVSAMGLPAISVPAGHDERGLPLGVQIVARTGEDLLALDVASLIELDPFRA